MEARFRPVRRRGLILLLGMLLLNIALVGWLILQALAQETRGVFILYLVAGVAAAVPLPIILYRLLSLIRASYVMDREGLHIQWGLRTEDIPMMEIDWIRSIHDIAFEIQFPALSFPGAVLGKRTHRDLGLIEFIASDKASLLLIATRDCIFAISPADENDFFHAFRHSAEMGSIAPIQRKSARADFLVGSLFSDKLARGFILAGALLSVVLLIWTAFVIPTRDTVPLGFNPAGQSVEASSSERLLLLPVLSLFTLVADIGLGAYLFQKKGFRTASYLVFASSLITPLSFLGLIAMIILS